VTAEPAATGSSATTAAAVRSRRLRMRLEYVLT
jgi:hypothetical protein